MTDLYIDLIIGVLAIVLGYATIRYNLGHYIIFVNNKKYDSNKVGKVAGTHILSYGFLAIILLIARYITKGSEVGDALNKASIVVIFAIGASMYYNIRKKCKLEKKEEKKELYTKKKRRKKRRKKNKTYKNM